MNDFGDDTIYALYEEVMLNRIKRSMGRDPVLTPVAITAPPPPPRDPDCPPTGVEFIAARTLGESGISIMKQNEKQAVSRLREKFPEKYGKASHEEIMRRIQQWENEDEAARNNQIRLVPLPASFEEPAE